VLSKFGALVSVIGLLVVTVAPVAAQVEVSGLTVSDSPDARESRAVLPTTATTVYVAFNYENAERTWIGVSLEGLGLTDIVVKRTQYTGKGRAVVAIKGSDIYQSVTSDLAGYALEAQNVARKAANQEAGQWTYIQDVQGKAMHIENGVAVLRSMQLDSARVGALVDLAAAAGKLDQLAQDALKLSAEQTAEIKAKAEAMKVPADDAVRLSKALEEGAGTVGTLVLPPTGAGSPYAVEVTVNTQPAGSVEFTVSGSPDAPSAASVPTQTPGGPTATPRVDPPTTPGGGGAPLRTATASRQAGASATAPAGATAVPAGPLGGARAATATASVLSGTPASASLAAATTGAVGIPVQGGSPGAGDVTSPAGDQAPVALPTWTVPSADDASALGGGQLGRAVGGRPAGRGGASGSNLGVLVVGVAALIGLALWLRQRM
jgi:hypothetical protein